MTALTNNRAAFSIEVLEFMESHIFGIWGVIKFSLGRDFKTLREDFYVIKFNKCVNVLQSSRMT